MQSGEIEAGQDIEATDIVTGVRSTSVAQLHPIASQPNVRLTPEDDLALERQAAVK